MICEKCRGDTVGDSLVEWCPKCTPREEILSLSLWALANRLGEIIRDSDGIKLKPDVGAGMLAEPGSLLAWEDARQSCWLGTLDTAHKALAFLGVPAGYGKVVGAP